MRTALTIAGSDSGGGAGIQADLKTFAAHGVYGASVITTVTAQNTAGVRSLFPLPADLVSAQIDAVAGDAGADATKVGMLSNAAIVRAVAAAIRRLKLPHVVVDPVMIATTGERLLDEAGVAALGRDLLAHASVVTPNVAEAEILARMSIQTIDQAIEAARRIVRDAGAAAVILKGGHLPGRDAVDVVVDGRSVHQLRGERLGIGRTHGTGCAFSSAVAANLALGRTLLDAAADAKAYVFGAMRAGLRAGSGVTLLDHFWRTPPVERLY